jgi:hypothetical protein
MIINYSLDLFLQIWGGICYLLAKVLLGISEGNFDGKKIRTAGWLTYLFGIPAWVILFASKNNWIVAAVDISSIPTMIFGIVTVNKKNADSLRFFDIIVKYFTILMIILGASYSIYYYKGITSFTQILEILVTFGFLFGTYLLAKKNPLGWALFALMSISTGTLMFLNEKILLAVQQGLCLIVAICSLIKGRHGIDFRRISP